MNDEKLRVLLIEDDAADADLLRYALGKSRRVQFEVVWADRLSAGLIHASEERFDVILLDLSLPDSHGLSTLTALQRQVNHIPIVILTGLNDEEIALKAMKQGAQDYLPKDEMSTTTITRVMRYAIERYKLLGTLQNLAITDALTGLYNRRGFFIAADQPVKLARRHGQLLSLVFVDMDGMKVINDTLGHHTGDEALCCLAHILTKTLRQSDILARIGGDEFVALATNTSPDNANVLVQRLQDNITAYNARNHKGYTLCVSVGVVSFNPCAPFTLEELLKQADALMYEQKQLHQRGRTKAYAT